jgi:hypothetical protein
MYFIFIVRYLDDLKLAFLGHPQSDGRCRTAIREPRIELKTRLTVVELMGGIRRCDEGITDWPRRIEPSGLDGTISTIR